MAGRKETHGWPISTVVVKRSTTGTSPVAIKPVPPVALRSDARKSHSRSEPVGHVRQQRGSRRNSRPCRIYLLNQTAPRQLPSRCGVDKTSQYASDCQKNAPARWRRAGVCEAVASCSWQDKFGMTISRIADFQAHACRRHRDHPGGSTLEIGDNVGRLEPTSSQGQVDVSAATGSRFNQPHRMQDWLVIGFDDQYARLQPGALGGTPRVNLGHPDGQFIPVKCHLGYDSQWHRPGSGVW